MRQLINKKLKIIFYILILFILSTYTNINFNKYTSDLFKIKIINIYGVSEEKKNLIYQKFENLINSNLFFLDKNNIKNDLDSFTFLDNYRVNKKYPSEVSIFLKETKVLANISVLGKNYFLGSNGRFIPTNKIDKNIPNIFGKFEPIDFFQLIYKLENNNFNLNKISDFYYFNSQRWDIKTNDGLLIKLPYNDLDKAIKNVSMIMLSEIEKKKIIDLRVSNQVIITNE